VEQLWTCPACGRGFANRNQTHACATYTLDQHLAGADPAVVALFERFRELVERCGPVVVIPEKTRIAFQVRMSFAVAMLRRRWLDGHVVLARRLDHPRVHRIETFSPRNHVHHFRIRSLDELDDDMAALLAEGYRVGEQRHLGRGGPGRPDPAV
jgi:hypothetical protein